MKKLAILTTILTCLLTFVACGNNEDKTKEKDNKDILKIIADNFRRCTVFVEIMPPVSVENVTEKSVEETDSKFIWGVQKGSQLVKLNSAFRWIRDVNLFDGMNKFKPAFRLFTWLPFLRRKMDYIAVLEK